MGYKLVVGFKELEAEADRAAVRVRQVTKEVAAFEETAKSLEEIRLFERMVEYADPARSALNEINEEQRIFQKQLADWKDPAEQMRLLEAGATAYQYRLNELTIQGDKFGSTWKQGFEGVDGSMSDMLGNMIAGTETSFDQVRKSFTRMLAEMANVAMVRPITISIMGVMSGVLGGSGTAHAQNLASQYGGSAGQMGGLFNTPNMPVSNLLPKSWTSGIGSFMSAPLPGTSIPGLMGPTPSGAALSNGLGLGSAMGYGAMGGLAYSTLGGMVGLPQNKYTGYTSAIGGTLGSWGGSALASSAMMAGGSFATGAALGSVVPIIGTILGALGGGLLGGLLGGEKKSRPSMSTQIINTPIDSDYDYTKAFTNNAWFDRAGAEEANKFMPILGEAATTSAKQIEALVAALPNEFRDQVDAKIKASVFEAGPNTPGMDKHNWNLQFYDEDQLKERLEQVVKDIQMSMGKVAQEAMSGIDISSMYNFDLSSSEGMDKAVKAVTSVKEITEATKEIAEPTSQLVQQAKAAKAQMDEWTASMQEYGVTAEYAKEVTEGYRQANINVAMDNIKDATNELLNPTSQLVQQAKAAKEQMTDWIAMMKEYGADETEVNTAIEDFKNANIDVAMNNIKDATNELLNPTSQFVASAKAAKEQMADWIAMMKEYGADEAEVNTAIEDFKNANIASAMQSIADATRAIVEPVSQIVQQAEAAKKQMDEWVTGVQEYGADMDALNAAVDEYQRASITATIDSLEASINPLSQYEQAHKAANSSVDERIAALRILGATEDELARVEGMRAQVIESMLGPMTLAFAQDLELRRAQLAGNDALTASTQLAIQHERELADVRAKFGESSSQYTQIQYMQVAEKAQLAWMQSLQAEAKAAQEISKAAQEASNKAAKAASEADRALSDAQRQLDAARNAYLAGLNKEASALQKTVDSITQAIDQIRRTQIDLRLSAETSTLGVAERYALSGAELDRVYAKAMGGDAEAMAELAALSSSYLNVSKEANADFSKYRKDFEKVQAMLSAVEASGLSQVSTAQKQLDLLNAQIAAVSEGTGQIVGSLKELEAAFLTALGQYADAQKAQAEAALAAAEAARKAAEAAEKAQGSSSSETKSWQQTILERKAADVNAGLFGPEWGTGWTADTVLDYIRRQGSSFEEWYAKYGKAEGYAKGGLAPAGWAMVGEEGPELVNFSTPGRVYTADETADMLAPRLTIAPAVNADSQAGFVRELVIEVRALRREVSELRGEQSRSQFRIVDAAQRTARTLERWDFDGMPEGRVLQ